MEVSAEGWMTARKRDNAERKLGGALFFFLSLFVSCTLYEIERQLLRRFIVDEVSICDRFVVSEYNQTIVQDYSPFVLNPTAHPSPSGCDLQPGGSK